MQLGSDGFPLAGKFSIPEGLAIFAMLAVLWRLWWRDMIRGEREMQRDRQALRDHK